MRESKIESKCVKLAKTGGWLTYKIQGNGQIGAPDRVFVSPEGYVHWVEFKRAKKKERPIQTRQHDILRKNMQMVHVIDDIDLFRKRVLGETTPEATCQWRPW